MNKTQWAPALIAGMSAHLQATGLLREYRGVWQYRLRVDGPWYCANNLAGAAESAQTTFDALPEAERLTPDERMARQDALRDAQNEADYAGKSDDELLAMLARLTQIMQGHQHAARREFVDGRRRTSAAVSAEAARDLGEIKMRLGGYMARRGVAL